MLKKYSGIFAFAMGCLFFILMRSELRFLQTVYFDYIYKGFHASHDIFRKVSPFDFTDLLLLLLIIGIIRGIWNLFFGLRSLKFRALNLIGWIGLWFLISWGFNYAQPSFSERALMTTTSELPDVIDVLNRCEALRNRLHQDPTSSAPLDQEELRDIDGLLNDFFSEEFPEYCLDGYVKPVSSEGWLRRLGIAGIYFPFSFQGHVDMSYTRTQVLFTAAHELSHAHGITDEGEANLIAYLALSRSNNPEYQYAAEFTLFRYLLSSRKHKNLEIPEHIQADLAAIRANYEAHPPFFSDLSSGMNNIYLKTMGVENGIQSYQTFPNLVQSFENTTPSHKRKSPK